MINPVPENLEAVLNSPSHLTVPRYQREYKWGTSEAGEFWEDLESYMESDEDQLFLGNFIFDVSNSPKKDTRIIDGQQRITTIILLLIACRELAKKINAQKIANKIQQKICFEDSTTGDSLGSRLKASESIRSVFDELCRDEWDGTFPEKLRSGKQVKRQSNRLKPIYNYFCSKIKDYDQNSLSRLLTTLYRSYIIRIDIENEIEAFKIFERTNARGIDLEASDLLKNYLFASLGNEESEIEEAWYRITELSDGTMLKMLKYYYVSKMGKISKSDLYKKLKVYGKTITPNKLLESLEEFANFYNAIRNYDSSSMKNYLEQVGLLKLIEDQERFDEIYYSIEGLRLFKITQIYPLIAAALSCYKKSGLSEHRSNNQKIVDFFKKLENYHFINNAVCERIGNEVENLYAEFSKKFAESDNFEIVANDLYLALKKQRANREEFVSRFTDISYQPSSIPLISYIFDRMNNFELSSGHRVKIFNADERVLRKSHNIEHFYPQNPSPADNLVPLTEEQVNSIRNLLCISFRTNSRLGNLSPSSKIERLQGDLSGEIANLPYVRKFIDEYKDYVASWDCAVIENRAVQLSEMAYDKIWKIN